MSICSIGICYKWYLFIFGTVFFKLLKFFFFSINPYNIKLFGFSSILSKHIFIQSFYKYISFMIGSLLFIYIIKKTTKSNNKNINFLIYSAKYSKEKLNIQTFLVCFIFFIHRESNQILYSFFFHFLDFWFFDFIFINLFMKPIFLIKNYKHQTCSMIFTIITNFTLLFISTFLPMYNNYGEKSFENQNSYEIIKIITNNKYSSIPILFGFLFLSFIISYARVKSKNIMYNDYTSLYKLIFQIGLVGSFFTMIGLMISSFFNCQATDIINKSICIYEENENNYYFDSIFIYFNDLKNNQNYLFEILLVTPIYLIICFLEFACEMNIIKYFNPFFVLLKDKLYFFFLRIILYFSLFYITLLQFIILETAEVFALLGLSIYLEIIELNCFGLDYNIKKNIIKRAELKIEDLDGPEDEDLDENIYYM